MKSRAAPKVVPYLRPRSGFPDSKTIIPVLFNFNADEWIMSKQRNWKKAMIYPAQACAPKTSMQ